MLDGWVEDAIESLVEINKSEGREPLNPEDEIAVTNAVFSMIKSYAFRDEFPGVVLKIADSDIQYSRIYLPEVNDPFDDGLEIRDEAIIHPLNFRFQYPEYLDDDDPEPVVWQKPEEPFAYMEHQNPVDCPKTDAILEKLRQKNGYYAKLLETDPERQIQNLKELDSFNYQYHPNMSYYELDRLTNMSQYSAGNVDHVFGHRYVGPGGERKFIVATNWLGPVGVLSIFDHSQKGVIDQDASRYSVSSVSVSPSYRRQGISANLMREALRVSMREEKYLTRTTPSEMGEVCTHDFFTDLAKTEFPSVPFVSNKESQYIHAVTNTEAFKGFPYKQKCKAVIAFANEIDRMVDSIIEEEPNCLSPYDRMDYEKLQGHADRILEECAKSLSLESKKGASLSL